jgi:hypothetical protein
LIYYAAKPFKAPIPEAAVEDKVGEISHASSDAAGDDILEDAPVSAEDPAGHDSERCAAAADDSVERSAIPAEAVAALSADLGVFVLASTLFDTVQKKMLILEKLVPLEHLKEQTKLKKWSRQALRKILARLYQVNLLNLVNLILCLAVIFGVLYCVGGNGNEK